MGAPTESPRVVREVQTSSPPGVLAIGARLGAAFGAIVAAFGGITGWLVGGSLVTAGHWAALAGGVSGIAVAVITPVALLVVARLRGVGTIQSTRQSTLLTLHATLPDALALAAEALEVLGENVRSVDLARGTALMHFTSREPLVGHVALEIRASVRTGSDGTSEVRFESDASFTQFDFGGARRTIERVVHRFDELATNTGPRNRLGADSLPAGAADMLRSRRWTLAEVHSLEPQAPAFEAKLSSVDGDRRRALVFPTGGVIRDALAKSLATTASAEVAQHARGGVGFFVVPLAHAEKATLLASALHAAVIKARSEAGDGGAPTRNVRRGRPNEERTTRDERSPAAKAREEK